MTLLVINDILKIEIKTAQKKPALAGFFLRISVRNIL